jgi:hypothetical protein
MLVRAEVPFKRLEAIVCLFLSKTFFILLLEQGRISRYTSLKKKEKELPVKLNHAHVRKFLCCSDRSS